jgi:hypothetical protein
MLDIHQARKKALSKSLLRKAILRYFAEGAIEGAVIVLFFLVTKLWLRDARIMTAEQADIFYFVGGPLSFVLWLAIKQRLLHRGFKVPQAS